MNTKTLEDLEFSIVLSRLSDLCLTELGKKYALRIKPFDNQESLLLTLNQTNEYLSSFDNNNTIPSHYCEPITSEIKLLSIENALLEVSSIRKIHRISEVVNTQILFFSLISSKRYTLLFSKLLIVLSILPNC